MKVAIRFYSILVLVTAVFSIIFGVGCAQDSSTSVTQDTLLPLPSATTQPVAPTATAVIWSEAKNHIGERITVYGPVIGATYASGSKGQPTFLNAGKNYPDTARFTVLIWGSDRSKFSPTPEIQYKGRTIYVYGLIELYQGSAEIIVNSPSQIQIR